MQDQIRDSSLGYFINRLSKGKYLPFPEEREDYVIPQRYLISPDQTFSRKPSFASGEITACNTPSSVGNELKLTEIGSEVEKVVKLVQLGLEKTELQLASAEKLVDQEYRYLVDWNDENGVDDQENPRNWPRSRKILTTFLIALLTFSVYIGSAIYTASIPSLISTFNVSETLATAGLTSFILGYGCAPMLLSPLQEIPSLGRNTVYIISLACFVIFQIPVLYANNIWTIIVFRFLAGVSGSPALATGGASMGDLYNDRAVCYAIGIWSLGGVSGPTLGPVIGGFAAMSFRWQAPILELLGISFLALVVLILLLPETFPETILHRRAQRLRKLTGNNLIKTRAELAATEGTGLFFAFKEQFIMAFVLTSEPAVLFGNLYIAFLYGLLYTWFEAFPLVFTDIYNFNLGVSGIPFVGFIVVGVVTFGFYSLYQKKHIEPRMDVAESQGNVLVPEARLELGLYTSFFIPCSLLIFGWSARESVHWIVPVIGAAIYLPGLYLAFQSVVLYITLGYPNNVASILAGNDLFRSTIAAFFPLFGRNLFTTLGLGPGCSLLAGIALLMIPCLWLLVRYGKNLRAKSKYAIVKSESSGRKSEVVSV